jgi:hypothetical protein
MARIKAMQRLRSAMLRKNESTMAKILSNAKGG